MTIPKKTWELKDSIVLLRILIGWHFLYEGMIKLYNPDWTSYGYLAAAQGPFKPIFTAITSQTMIGWVDGLNMAALIIVGLTLTLGFFEKTGAFIGMGLLALYYLAHPSFPWLAEVNVEGSYWFVNKNLIEFVACLVLFQFPTARYFGLARLFAHKKKTLKTTTV